MPTLSIEKYLIVLNTHFQEEAKTRKALHQVEQNLSQHEFVLYSRSLELPNFPQNSDAFNYANNEIEALKKTIQTTELQLRQEREKALELERKRQGIESSWMKLGIQEPLLSQLSVEMKKHALSISSLEYECKESQNKAVLEQKDQYIKLLEEQLRIRDSIIETNQDLIRKSPDRVLSNLKSFEEISAQSVIIAKKGDYARSLPPISHSRIPRLKNVSPTSSVRSKGRESTNLPSLVKNSEKDNKDKFKDGSRRRYAHKIRSYSTGSSDSEESNASSYVQSEKRAQIRRPAKINRGSNASPKFRKQVYKL